MATREKKTAGQAVGRLLKRETREHVGYLYEWNTGERQNAWFGEAETDVIIEEMKDDESNAPNP